MTRVDICPAEDHETRALLFAVIHELGGRGDGDDWHESPLGVGLQTFRFEAGELTVFADAWGVDIAGPDGLVRRVLAAMANGPE